MKSYRGMIRLTFGDLRKILGLPDNVEIEFLESDCKTKVGQFYIRSNEMVEELTFETFEGSQPLCVSADLSKDLIIKRMKEFIHEHDAPKGREV